MKTIKSIVARRTLTCKLTERTAEATVHVSLPFEEDGMWICEYGVTFVDGTREQVHKIVGEDSMQALQLAIAMLGSTLPNMEATSDWRWNDEPYTGLPNGVQEPVFGNMP